MVTKIEELEARVYQIEWRLRTFGVGLRADSQTVIEEILIGAVAKGALVSLSGTDPITISRQTPRTISWQLERHDTNNMFSLSVPDRIFSREAGVFLTVCQFDWPAITYHTVFQSPNSLGGGPHPSIGPGFRRSSILQGLDPFEVMGESNVQAVDSTNEPTTHVSIGVEKVDANQFFYVQATHNFTNSLQLTGRDRNWFGVYKLI